MYIAATIIEHGDERGVGQVVDLTTRGFLPYVLRWRLRISDSHEPLYFAFTAWGDLVGHGSWKIFQQGSRVTLLLDWNVRVEQAVVRLLPRVFRPLIIQNHVWSMAKGEIGLQVELHRQCHRRK